MSTFLLYWGGGGGRCHHNFQFSFLKGGKKQDFAAILYSKFQLHRLLFFGLIIVVHLWRWFSPSHPAAPPPRRPPASRTQKRHYFQEVTCHRLYTMHGSAERVTAVTRVWGGGRKKETQGFRPSFKSVLGFYYTSFMTVFVDGCVEKGWGGI